MSRILRENLILSFQCHTSWSFSSRKAMVLNWSEQSENNFMQRGCTNAAQKRFVSSNALSLNKVSEMIDYLYKTQPASVHSEIGWKLVKKYFKEQHMFFLQETLVVLLWSANRLACNKKPQRWSSRTFCPAQLSDALYAQLVQGRIMYHLLNLRREKFSPWNVMF